MKYPAFAVMVLVAGLNVAPDAAAQDNRIAPFLGQFVGQIVFGTDRGLEKRELDVTIRREGAGFSVEWSTIAQKAGGKIKTRTHFVAFGKPDRRGIYLPTGKVDRFGANVVVDPLKGGPQVWADVSGKTLTVNAMIHTDRGGLEKQVYQRTLIPGGLELNFSRTRNGQPLKSLHVKMKAKDQRLNLR